MIELKIYTPFFVIVFASLWPGWDLLLVTLSPFSLSSAVDTPPRLALDRVVKLKTNKLK